MQLKRKLKNKLNTKKIPFLIFISQDKKLINQCNLEGIITKIDNLLKIKNIFYLK